MAIFNHIKYKFTEKGNNQLENNYFIQYEHVKDGLLQLPETKGKKRRFISISDDLAQMIKSHRPKSRS
ncbi:hypothetical protein, partial [Alteromonas sp. a30]|uniref:hypothetical protein n=1 Tax=Alteromonas sp. a30 TaxID=2730917 RepID=UPI00227F148A